jgi:hypothetical protein
MKKTSLFVMAALAVGASLFLAQPAFSQAAYMGKPGTATATAGAATLQNQSGVVTSEALTTAAGANYTLTITNAKVTTSAVCFASVSNGTNTTVEPVVTRVTPGSGSLVVVVRNLHATVALNGTIKIAYQIYNP